MEIKLSSRRSVKVQSRLTGVLLSRGEVRNDLKKHGGQGPGEDGGVLG